MIINRLSRRVSNTIYAIVVVLVMAPMMAFAAQRPISDFLSTQGTYSNIFVPPVPDYVGWADAPNTRFFALIDYAGVANKWLKANGGADLGTRSSGNITERKLSDGRAQVTVTLRTTNALSWATPCCYFANGPLIFGQRAQDVLQNKAAALGNVQFQMKFINTALGAPLPDLIQLLFAPAPGQEFTSYAFSSHATGAYCNGTVGGMTVSQTANIPHRSNVQAAIIKFAPPLPQKCP